MTFHAFFYSLSPCERSEFAVRCETSVAHLRNIAHGKKCGESLAINIDRESCGRVVCEELRPDVDWAYLRNCKEAA